MTIVVRAWYKEWMDYDITDRSCTPRQSAPRATAAPGSHLTASFTSPRKSDSGSPRPPSSPSPGPAASVSLRSAAAAAALHPVSREGG